MDPRTTDWNSRPDPSDESLDAFHAANGKWAEQQYDMAYDHYFSGNWAEAQNHAKAAVEACPFQPTYRLLLAQIYCARDRLNLAWSELLILKQQDPENAGAKSLTILLKRKMDESDSERRKGSKGSGFMNALTALFKG
jgi:predicted Zn-dependent protease